MVLLPTVLGCDSLPVGYKFDNADINLYSIANAIKHQLNSHLIIALRRIYLLDNIHLVICGMD